MEWKKIKSPKQQISNFFGSQGSHIDYSSFPRNAWVLKWKLVFFSFGRQICITVPERKRGEMGMKIASLQLKKRANALIVFRFREKQNTEKKWLIHSSHYAHNESVERFGKGSVHELHELKALKTLKKKKLNTVKCWKALKVTNLEPN